MYLRMKMLEKAHASPRSMLTRLLVGNQVQQAIYVAAKLSIADLLADGPRSSEELAQATGAHPGALRRLLRVLASFGVFAEDEQRSFGLTPAAELLRREVPGSMRAFALWSGDVRYEVFGALEYSVRTGKPAFERIVGTDFYDYLVRDPEAGALFDEMMSWNTRPVAAEVAAYDLSGVDTVIDVGGGRGELLAAVLSAHPALRGVLVDHDRVIPQATQLLGAAGVLDRCAVVAGDILRSVPVGGDVYILKSVIHGQDDTTASRVLGNCRRAMNEGGRVLLVEFVMPPGNDPFPGKLMDLLMLVGGHGLERSEEEFRALFSAAGLQLTKLAATRFGYSMIEGRAA